MDLKLDSDGDLAIEDDELVLIDGADAVAQDVDIRLSFFLGEWFLDERIGVPYFQKILGKKPRLLALKGIFQKAILTTPGLLSITDLDVTYEGSTRVLNVSFRGVTEDGIFDYDKELIV